MPPRKAKIREKKGKKAHSILTIDGGEMGKRKFSVSPKGANLSIEIIGYFKLKRPTFVSEDFYIGAFD